MPLREKKKKILLTVKERSPSGQAFKVEVAPPELDLTHIYGLSTSLNSGWMVSQVYDDESLGCFRPKHQGALFSCSCEDGLETPIRASSGSVLMSHSHMLEYQSNI